MLATIEAVASRERARRRRRITVAAALVAASLTGGAVFTSSQWTASKQITGNAFSSGNVSLTLSPASAVLTMSNMVPGDVITKPITVTNSGTADLRYAVSSTTTENTLSAALQLVVDSGVSAANCNAGS